MIRLASIILLLVLSLATAHAIAQREKAPAETKQSNADEDQIRTSVVAFVKQYNAHKADEVAALFAPDARMVFQDGTEVNGRDEIKATFEEAFLDSPKVGGQRCRGLDSVLDPRCCSRGG